jgi:hypothetical protein
LRPNRNMKIIASCCLVLVIGHMLIVIAWLAHVWHIYSLSMYTKQYEWGRNINKI